jgi:hypothetical protein
MPSEQKRPNNSDSPTGSTDVEQVSMGRIAGEFTAGSVFLLNPLFTYADKKFGMKKACLN